MTLAVVCLTLALARFLLSFHRDSYEPVEKPVRRKDSKLWKALSRLPYCEHCGRRVGVSHNHHIRSRGAGGPDSRENCLALCPACHDDAHRGKISREKLLAIASAPFRFIPGYD